MHLKEHVLPVSVEPQTYLTKPLKTGLLTGPPTSFQELKLEGAASNGGAPNLDLGKLYAFFKGTEFLNRITKTRAEGGPKTAEAIEEAFVAYCRQLKARKVAYQFFAKHSPFDVDFTGTSDCKGQAKGFLQLMAVMGVARDSLATILADGQEECKIAKLGSHSIDSKMIFCVPNSSSDYACNALTARLENGKLTFSRTDREPFANHYAARVNIPSAGFKYWDPLFSCGYRNGLSNYFESYRKDNPLSEFGIDCYIAPTQPQRRLYLLPSEFNKELGRDTVFQAALRQTIQDTKVQKPRLYVIIDEGDWGAEPPQWHPPVIRRIRTSALSIGTGR